LINNRQQNGRRRGRGGNGGGGGGGQRNGNPGRPDTGNRIDNRARGNANQLFEKYRNLARDAQMSGDRVNTEYYLQFADHYFRVLSESRSRFEDQNQPQPRRQSNDSFDAFDGGDDDYGDEGEPIRAGEQAGDDSRGNRYEQREPRANGGGSADGREVREPREMREQNDRGDRGDREARRNNNGAPERETEDRTVRVSTPVANDLGDLSLERNEAAAEPRRPRRPRRDRAAVSEEEAPVAIEADRLPPSLGIVSEPAVSESEADSVDEPKPRRRRLRTVNGGDVTPVS
jgi:hypothetical protein